MTKKDRPEPIEVVLLRPKVIELTSFLNLLSVMLDMTREGKPAQPLPPPLN